MQFVKELHKCYKCLWKYYRGCIMILLKQYPHMKLFTFISAGAFLFFSALIMKERNDRQDAPFYDTKWKLKKIYTGTLAEEVSTKAYIRFNEEKKSGGGNGSCNSFGSTITVSGNSVSLKDIFSTKMYCEGVQTTENAFFKQLGNVNRFAITGEILQLYHDKDLLLEFAADRGL